MPKILVGLKSDRQERKVAPSDVEVTRRNFGFLQYVECSAKHMEGIPEVFTAGAEAALNAKNNVK